jgi:thioesterase domain-containing protein/aryl carrier-like protein
MNQYGPSETHVVTAYDVCGELYWQQPLPPIGKPIANTVLYVLDDRQKPVPIGVAGEICIGGVALGRGYLNQKQLTAEKFVANPFRAGEKMYKTGDLGRWLPDGNLEYLGRMDEQVKIRGYRVELGEIETVIHQSGLVKQAVVGVREDPQGNKQLVGYVVAEGDLNRPALVTYLQGQLPAYMVPQFWVQLEAMPMTRNGKTDKRALPEVADSDQQAGAYVAPRNETEATLAQIWQEVLGVERVGIHDNFFALGGHSLIIFQMLNSIRKKKYQIHFRDFFKYQTIQELSEYLSPAVNPPGAGRATGSGNAGWAGEGTAHVQILNEGNSERSLFILPGAPGFSDGYDELAKAFGPQHRVYGVQTMGLNEGEKPLPSLVQNAELMYAWIKQVQPQGPYQFIGHSLGVHLAYELTRQFESKGDEVPFVVILDTSIHLRSTLNLKGAKNICDDLLETIGYFLWSWGINETTTPDWAGDLKARLNAPHAKDKTAVAMEYVRGKIGHIANLEFILRALYAFLTQSQMLYYPAGKVKARLLVVKAESEDWSKYNAALGWNDYADQVQAISTPGNHMSLVRGINAPILAKKIREHVSF